MIGKEAVVFAPKEIRNLTLNKDPHRPGLEELSLRELEVLENLANGRTYKEIQETLPLHLSSLKRDLSSIRNQLGLNIKQSVCFYMDAKKEGALPPKEFSGLTNKQKQAFKLIVQGYPIKQISEALGIETQSAYNFHDPIFQSFGVSTLSELLIKLVDIRIIDPHRYIENVKKTDNNFLNNVNTASDISSLLSKISETEMVVLDAFVTSIKGGTNTQIADLLHITEYAVQSRFSSISRKLGRANREHAAMWYMAAISSAKPQMEY